MLNKYLHIFLAPLARPIVPVESFKYYSAMIGLDHPSNEGHQLETMPQFYADMFGWEELAQNVSKDYLTLPEEERKNTVVYCSNYEKPVRLNTSAKNTHCLKLFARIIVAGIFGRKQKSQPQ